MECTANDVVVYLGQKIQFTTEDGVEHVGKLEQFHRMGDRIGLTTDRDYAVVVVPLDHPIKILTPVRK